MVICSLILDVIFFFNFQNNFVCVCICGTIGWFGMGRSETEGRYVAYMDIITQEKNDKGHGCHGGKFVRVSGGIIVGW